MSNQMTKEDVVRRILSGRRREATGAGRARASVNIALCKYWGKRDHELNLPQNSSLSVTLGGFDVEMEITPTSGKKDELVINGQEVTAGAEEGMRVEQFLDLFRTNEDLRFRIVSRSTVPPAAGLASSAAAFAALVKALDDLFGWGLEPRELSILARLGSGSACRSIYRGAVVWEKGTRADGMDSYARPLDVIWEEFRVGVVVISGERKAVGSREGMNHTVATSPLYRCWPPSAERDLEDMLTALESRDLVRLGELVEANALAMHATMLAARPALCYWLPETVAAMREVWSLRGRGVRVYFTIDAGPNVKLIYGSGDSAAVREVFPALREFSPLAADQVGACF